MAQAVRGHRPNAMVARRRKLNKIESCAILLPDGWGCRLPLEVVHQCLSRIPLAPTNSRRRTLSAHLPVGSRDTISVEIVQHAQNVPGYERVEDDPCAGSRRRLAAAVQPAVVGSVRTGCDSWADCPVGCFYFYGTCLPSSNCRTYSQPGDQAEPHGSDPCATEPRGPAGLDRRHRRHSLCTR